MEDKDLEACLLAIVKELFSGPNREDLSVNNVRTKCEKQNGLEKGFLAKGDWKSKSKELIKNQVVRHQPHPEECGPRPELTQSLQNELLAKEENGEPTAEEKEPSPKPKGKKPQKNGTKPPPPKATKPAPKKRQTKAAPKPKSDSESELSEPPEDEDDEEDDASDDYEEEKAKPKKRQQKKAKPPQRSRKRKATETDDEEETPSIVADGIEVSTTGVSKEADETEDSPLSDPPKSEKEETKPSAAAKDEDDTSSLSSVVDDEPPPPKKQRKSTAAPAKKGAKAAAEDDDGDSSELSSVIDDEPPAKKKRKSKEPAGKKAAGAATKGAGGRKTAGGAAEEADPDEAEVKKLQGQLVKCGVRKIWGVELKGCGGDAKAKVRHLRQMLRDAGMDGRFSEAKAREIKERRELAAELEAVNEMNDLWGVGGRPRRRAAAPKGRLAEESESDDDGSGGDKDGREGENRAEKGAGDKDGGDDEDEDSDAPKVSGRRRKVRPELAFLGDDDSDED